MAAHPSRYVGDAPDKEPSVEAMSDVEVSDVEVVDPTHPLFGRRFPLASSSSTLTGPGFVWVLYRGDTRLRLPLAATNLATARAATVGEPLGPTKLTPAAIRDLLTLATQYSLREVPCPSAPPTCGTDSRGAP